MGLFENKKFTLISISVLVILNLVLIGFITTSAFDKRDRNRKGGEDRRAEYIANQLGFSASQKQEYDSLNASHGRETKALQQKVDEKRRAMFRLTRSKDASFETADSLTAEIGLLVSDMELRTYEHISNVRALCTPQQLEKLDSLIQKMIRSRRDNGNKKDSPPRN
jgi:Spy/CpxP family protein refolding chaperone